MKKNTAYMGLLLAFALILSYVESLLPVMAGIPGVKLGLANLAVLLALYLFGWKEALSLSVMKVFAACFLFGNMSMLLYSLAGSACSLAVMILFKKLKAFHQPVVSALGGVAHNMGQLLVAYFVVRTYGIFYYIPVLLISGLITGLVLGTAAVLMQPYLLKILERGIG